MNRRNFFATIGAALMARFAPRRTVLSAAPLGSSTTLSIHQFRESYLLPLLRYNDMIAFQNMTDALERSTNKRFAKVANS